MAKNLKIKTLTDGGLKRHCHINIQIQADKKTNRRKERCTGWCLRHADSRQADGDE